MYNNQNVISSRSSGSSFRNLLSRVDNRELKLLRVAVRRSNITSGSTLSTLERGIDDPAKIVPLVHHRKDQDKVPKPPIFGKEIIVNQDFNTEKRLVITDNNKLENDRRPPSRSYSRSLSRGRRDIPQKTLLENSSGKEDRRDTSPRQSNSRRSRSPRRNKSRSCSSTRERRRSVERRKSAGRGRSRSRERYKKKSRSRSYSKSGDYSRDKDTYRKSKSPTPLRPGEYRPNHPDLKFRYEKRSRSPRDREYEKYRDHKSRSTSRDRISRPSTSRRSTTPSRTKRKYSRSPGRSENRRSISSPVREKIASSSRYGLSPRGVRRSRSPHRSYKSSPRKSRSPTRHERRSRSPRTGERRSSPRRLERRRSRHSRSPYRHDRRRSRSPYKRSSRSPNSRGFRTEPTSREVAQVAPHGQFIPPELAYYGDYWMPGLMRPDIPYPRFYPPPMGQGFPLVFPSRMPMNPRMRYPQPRQHLPVYNSGVVKQRPKAPSKGEDAAVIHEDRSNVQPQEQANEEIICTDMAEGSSIIVEEMTDGESNKKDNTSNTESSKD